MAALRRLDRERVFDIGPRRNLDVTLQLCLFVNSPKGLHYYPSRVTTLRAFVAEGYIPQQ